MNKEVKLVFLVILMFFLIILSPKYANAYSIPSSGYYTQHGTFVMPLGTTKMSVPIEPVNNVSRAFVIVHQWMWPRNVPVVNTTAAAGDAAWMMVSAYLPNESEIVFERNNSVDGIYITWMVVESLNKEFIVYQGQKNFSNLITTTANDSLPLGVSVNPNNTIAWQTLSTSLTADHAGNMMFFANISNSTMMIFRRGGTGAINGSFRWVVVEFNTSKISKLQKGAASLTGGEAPGSPLAVTINVTKNQSFLFYQCAATGNDDGADQAATNGYLFSNTVLRFFTYSGTNPDYAALCQWQIIDFGINIGKRNETNAATFAAAASTQTNNFSNTVQLNRSMAFVYTTINDATATLFPRGAVFYNLTPVNITYQRTLNGSIQHISWQILELPFNFFPNITSFTEPRPGDVFGNQSIDFNFTVNDADGRVENCTLWGNFTGAFLPNNTLINPSEIATNTIQIMGLTTGTYKSNIECIDENGASVFYPINKTFYVDTDAPIISSAILNATLINQTHQVMLNITATDWHNITSGYATLILSDTSSINIDLIKTSDTSFYLTFGDTNITGIYNFTNIILTDEFGNLNNKSYSNLTFNVTLSPPEIFNLISPFNNTESQTLIPNFSWAVSEDELFDKYELLISTDYAFSSIDFNYTTYGKSNTSVLVNSTLLENIIYYWKVTAYDIFGSSVNSTNYFVYITDTSPPFIELNYPDDNAVINAIYSEFNYTPDDTNTLKSCELYFGALGNFTPIATNNSINKLEVNTFSLFFDEGIYLWNIWCNDSANNSIFSSNNRTLTIDSSPPNITLISPNDLHIENTTNNVNFTINASDKWSNISNCEFILDDAIEQIKENVINNEITIFEEFIGNGNFTWFVNCTDTNGFESSSEKRNISINVVDSNPPLITLNFPENDNYSSSNDLITFNYTIEDATGVSNCSLYLDNIFDQTNSTIFTGDSNYFSKAFIDEGKHVWDIRCFDNSTTYNLGLSAQRNITVDLTNPIVTPDTANNSIITLFLSEFNYTIIDNNLESCELYTNFSGSFTNSSTTSTPINNTINSLNDTASFDGIYIWNVLCIDKSKRASFSNSNYTIRIDTLSPYYSNNISPVSPQIYNSSANFQFNITWEDIISVDTVLFESNFSGSPSNITMISSGNNVYGFSSTLSAGEYYYIWHANDTVGHTNSSSIYYFSVQQAAPTIALYLNGTQGDYSINENSTLNVTTSLINPDSGYLELYLDGVMINNGTSPLTNLTLFETPGIFNISSLYYSTQNYTDGQASYLLTVNDTSSPIVTGIYPSEGSTIGLADVTIQYNITDFSAIRNCSLYINNTLNETVFDVTKPTPDSFIKTLDNGNYNYRIDCFDYANNFGQTQNINFTVLKVSSLTINITTLRPQYVNDYEANFTIRSYAGQTTADTNITTDIILGNATKPWWNTSWSYRKPILLNDTVGINHIEWQVLNVSGLSGDIANCTKEIRIIKQVNTDFVIENSSVTGGDNSNYCIVEFNANITLNAVNENNYYIYYSNPLATNPSFNFSQIQINVQRGIINAASGTSLGATLSQSINPSNSFLLFNSLSGGSTSATGMFTGNITSSTIINFTRYTSAIGNISWQAIEHPWINVQRGLTPSIAVDEVNMTINSVNLSKSFIIINGRANSATASQRTRGMFTASFINSTTIRIKRVSTITAGLADYQVVEWNGANVINGSTSIGAGVTTASVNLAAPIIKNNTFLVFSTRHSATTGNIQDVYAIGQIINNTQINFTRVGVTGILYVEYFIVTIPNGAMVLEDITSVNAGAISATPQLSQSIILNKTFSVSSWNSTGAATTYINAYHLINISNTTNLNLKKQASTYDSRVATYLPQIYLTNFSQTKIGNPEKFVVRYTNQTGTPFDTGVFNFIWNTTNNSLGNYSIVVQSNLSGFNSGVGYLLFEIINDTIAPNITLTAPQNNFNTPYDNITFTFSSIDDFSEFINCQLSINSSGQTNFTLSNNETKNYSTNLTLGEHTWNLTCTDKANNTNSLINYVFTIIGPPSITASSFTSNNQSITLNWTSGIGADSYNIYNKSNYLDNFSSTPIASGITDLNWTDNNANLSNEIYYIVESVKGIAKTKSAELVARKRKNINSSWETIAFSYNLTYNTLGNFAIYKNPINIQPTDAILSIYRFNSSRQSWESVNYTTGGWVQSIGSESFTSLELGRGYWLEMSKNATITYLGIVTNSTFNVSLYEGWNLIGSTTPTSVLLPTNNEPTYPFTVTPNNSITKLWTYDSNMNDFNQTTHADDWGWWALTFGKEIWTYEPNTAYYAEVIANSTWEVER